MVVTASRQPAYRPETIRTRLARFMPKAAAAAWAVAWSAQTERSDEIQSEDELAAAEHIGCFGAAMAHGLARAEIAATQLQVTADAPASIDGSPMPITIEIRAKIAGPALDRSVIESIARRAEVACPVWRGLAADGRIQFMAVLDEPSADSTPAGAGKAATRPPAAAPKAAPMPAVNMPRLALPTWLTPKLAIVLALGSVVIVMRLLPMVVG